MQYAHTPPLEILRRVEADYISRHGQMSSLRVSRRKALQNQTGGSRSRAVLRLEVSERLGRNILDDFRSDDCSVNPLVDPSDADCVQLSQLRTDDLSSLEPRRALAHRELRAEDSVDQSVQELIALKAHMHSHDPADKGLDMEQFSFAMKGRLWASKSRAELSQLFMQIDVNSDGRISWEELITFLLLKDQKRDESTSQFQAPSSQDSQMIPGAHTGPITHLLHFADKEKYATLGMDSTLRLWHCGTLQHARTVPLPDAGWATDALYVPSIKRLAIATAHSKLTLYDSMNLKLLHSWRLRATPQCMCSLDEGGQPEWTNSLLLGDHSGVFSVFEWSALNAGRFVPKLEHKLHSGWIERLEYLRDLGGVMSCSSDGTLQLSDLGRGTCSSRNRLSNPSAKPISSFAWCPSHAMVATCGVERHIHWWSPSIARPLMTLYGHAAAVTKVTIDESHHQLISRSVDQVVRVWDVRTHQCVQVIDPGKGQGAAVLVHDAINQCLLTADRAPIVHTSIFAKKARDREVMSSEPEGMEDSTPLSGAALVGSICNTNLNLLLTVDEHSTVRTWHLTTGEPCFRFNARSKHVGDAELKTTAISLDDSGRRLLTGAQDGRVRVFNFSRGHCLCECLPPNWRRGSPNTSWEITTVLGVRHANSQFIVACGWSREIWFWPDQAGSSSFQIECCRVLRGHAEDVLCASFCAPNVLATGGFDGIAMVWNLDSGAVKGRLLHERVSDHIEAVVDRKRAQLTGSSSISVEHLTFVSLATDQMAPLLISAGSDSRLRCWCSTTLGLLFVFPLLPPGGAYCGVDAITMLSWNQSSATLMIGDAAGRTAFWSGAKLENALNPLKGATDGQTRANSHMNKVLLNPADVYQYFEPLQRWRAHSTSVVGSRVVRTEDVIASTGDWDQRDGLPPALEFLVMTAACDGTVRLWTRDGAHVGSFGRDTWQIWSRETFGPPPRITSAETRTTWDAPPIRKERDEASSEDANTMFLTAIPLAGAASGFCTEDTASQQIVNYPGPLDKISDEALPPHSLSERERLLEMRAQEGVQRALGSMSAQVSQVRLSTVPIDNSMPHSASAPMLPPVGGSMHEDAGQILERDRAHARARARLAAKVSLHREFDNEAQTVASDAFLHAREKAARAEKPPPRRLKIYELAPLQRHEPLRERLGRLSSRGLFADM